MCGRINLTSAPHVLAETFFLDHVPDISPRFNICPGQNIGAVLAAPDSPGRRFRLMQWGLIPTNTRRPDDGPRLINARSETVAEKKSFAESFALRRCLVPVTGFYEWKKSGSGRQPYLFRRRDGEPFALAGLWSRWERPGEKSGETCTILTTSANSLMRPIHHRMPVVLPAADWKFWLDLPAEKVDLLHQMMKPAPAGDLVTHPVSREVNRPDFDDPRCLEPVRDEGDDQLALF